MKKATLVFAIIVVPLFSNAQSYPHITMFMFNKLLYDPAYAGEKGVTTVNAFYRTQWTGIDGAPKTFNMSIDGSVGNPNSSFRHVALGVNVNYEQLGITTTTNAMAYYAYRILTGKSILSFGLQAGAALYSARYNDLNPYQQNDPSLVNNFNNIFLPNVGAGVYWSGDNFYAGAAVPNLLQNYYDKNINTNDEGSKQLRSYYACGGYVFAIGEKVKLLEQMLCRYAGNRLYNLPFSSDFNVSEIFYDRIMFGITYRTDKSFEGIVHVQVTNNVNIGYAYDYYASVLQPYTKGSHEVTVGFDFIKDRNKASSPRFVKLF